MHITIEQFANCGSAMVLMPGDWIKHAAQPHVPLSRQECVGVCLSGEKLFATIDFGSTCGWGCFYFYAFHFLLYVSSVSFNSFQMTGLQCACLSWGEGKKVLDMIKTWY